MSEHDARFYIEFSESMKREFHSYRGCPRGPRGSMGYWGVDQTEKDKDEMILSELKRLSTEDWIRSQDNKLIPIPFMFFDQIIEMVERLIKTNPYKNKFEIETQNIINKSITTIELTEILLTLFDYHSFIFENWVNKKNVFTDGINENDIDEWMKESREVIIKSIERSTTSTERSCASTEEC